MDAPHQKSTGSLLADAAQQVADLVRGQVELARAEAQEKLRQALGGLVLLLAAAILAIAVLNLLCGAAVSWLVAQGIAPASAALIVAGAVAALAIVLGWAGVRWIAPSRLYPRRTAESLRRDAEQIKEIVTHDPSS